MWPLLLTILLTWTPMAELAHAAITPITTAFTTTSTAYVDVTNAAIASGSFVAGGRYRIKVCALIRNNNNANETWLQMVHGSTAFAESEILREPPSSALGRMTYHWGTVWTAVAGEGIKLQIKVSATTGEVDQITLVAYRLDVGLTEGVDWFFAESATDVTLTTTFTAGASVTFTPGTANDDWKVETHAMITPAILTTRFRSRINESRAATVAPNCRMEAEDLAERYILPNVRVFTLPATSGTLKEETDSSAVNDHTRTHSSIFILNLNKLRNHGFVYTDGIIDLSATDFATLVETLSYTPAVAGDSLVIASFTGGDAIATGIGMKMRLQHDDADDPATQTTDAYLTEETNDSADECPFKMQSMINLTAAAHTFDMDGSIEAATAGDGAKQRSLIAFSMELAAGGPQTFQRTEAETVGLTEALVRRVLKGLAETVALTEEDARQVQRAIAETVSLTEALTPLRVKNLAEALSLTEALAKQAGKSLAETVSLTEAQVRQAAKTFGETLGMTEADALQVQKSLAETLGLSEALSTTVVKLLTVADTVGLTETDTILVAKALAEAVTLTEAQARQARKAFSETVALSEALAKLAGKTVAETLGLSENLVASSVKLQTIAETVALTEVLSRRVNKAIAESLGLSEDLAPEARKVMAEAIGFTEAVQQRIARAIGEAVGLTEQVRFGFFRVLADSVALTEAFQAEIVFLGPPATVRFRELGLAYGLAELPLVYRLLELGPAYRLVEL